MFNFSVRIYSSEQLWYNYMYVTTHSSIKSSETSLLRYFQLTEMLHDQTCRVTLSTSLLAKAIVQTTFYSEDQSHIVIASFPK